MLLIIGIVSVIIALVLYSISTFFELRKKRVYLWILVLFWVGLIFDYTGTISMSLISKGFSLNFHSLSGILALLLMTVKAIWSTLLFSKNKKVPKILTILVWIFWVFVFLLGIFLA